MDIPKPRNAPFETVPGESQQARLETGQADISGPPFPNVVVETWGPLNTKGPQGTV
jgi:hypothetical protein